MAKAAEITVDINCNLQVDGKTALTCLHLVQIYLNNNSDVKLSQKKLENGEVELFYEPFEGVHGTLPAY